jgi:hypothetical protein
VPGRVIITAALFGVRHLKSRIWLGYAVLRI